MIMLRIDVWPHYDVGNVPACIRQGFFLECAVYSGAHASYHRRCRIRQAEQKKLDDCHSLRDSFYPATEDLEPKTKLEAPQDSSSAAGPMVLVDMSPAQGNRSQHQAVPRPSSSRAEYSQTCR